MNNEQPTMNFLKRTQSNPILPAVAGKIALSEACGERSRTVEGPVIRKVEPFIFGLLTL
jgi:hypothetical protein